MTASKVTLFHAPHSRSSTALWMMEEIGQPYDLQIIDFKAVENRQSTYLAINPLGKVPAIQHNSGIVTETTAILTYLADAFPAAKLAPAIGDPRRGPYLRWMFFYAASFEPAVVDKAMKREPGPIAMSPYGTFEMVIDTIDTALATGPYLLGDQFTAADVMWGSGLDWTMGFGITPKQPHFLAYVERINARPARKSAQAKDAELKKAMPA